MTTNKGPMRPAEAENRKAVTLTQAALASAKHLGLPTQDLAAVLGVPPGSLAGMREGKRYVDGLNGEAERADALVRIVKRLSVLLGDSETQWRSWIRRENDALDAIPLDVMKRRDGAQIVAQYLETQGSLAGR